MPTKLEGRMPIRILMLTLAWLALAGPAEGATTWVGTRLNFPVPGRDIGDTQLGVDAGVTLTHMMNAYVGVGADLIYHYWPASDEYAAALDRYLRGNYFETLDGSTWAFTALQKTGHVKLVAPVGRRCASWAQVGLGTYRVDRNLEERTSEGTYAWVVGRSPGGIRTVGGWYGEVGLDFKVSPSAVLGLNATFHHLFCHDKGWSQANDLPDFYAFTMGTHVMFGWKWGRDRP